MPAELAALRQRALAPIPLCDVRHFADRYQTVYKDAMRTRSVSPRPRALHDRLSVDALPTEHLRRRVLVTHHDVYYFGGAEHLCVRMLKVLQTYFEEVVVLHAGGPLDVARIEKWYGVRLDPERVRFETVSSPRWLRWVSRLFAVGRMPILLQYALVLRAARSMKAGADLIISTQGECAIWDASVIQYIHYPMFFLDRESLAHLGATDLRIDQWLARACYVLLARRLCGWRPSIVASHLTLANSQWTAAEFRQRYGGYIPRVLYPGSHVSLGPGDPDWLPFVERENNFVIVGRIVPGKRIEEAVEIVRRLRERGRGLGLHIVGGEAGSGRYGARLRAMLADKPWVHMHTGLSRPALERLVARQKWGLHCYRFEHYGIAPAELQRLGCIVFVHDFGRAARGYCESGSALHRSRRRRQKN